MPFKQSDDPKDQLIKLRASAGQKHEIEAAAARRNLSVSEYVLRRALNKQAPERYDFHAIDALERLALELKQHYQTCEGRDEDYLQAFMDRLTLVSEAVWRGRRPA